jgi:hypothetical protein
MGIAAFATKVASAPLTKKIVVTVAGAVASYFTQIYVGKAYEAIFDVETEELES